MVTEENRKGMIYLLSLYDLLPGGRINSSAQLNSKEKPDVLMAARAEAAISKVTKGSRK